MQDQCLSLYPRESPFILKRSDAYIGVLIDEPVTKGLLNLTGCSPPEQNTVST